MHFEYTEPHSSKPQSFISVKIMLVVTPEVLCVAGSAGKGGSGYVLPLTT